MIRCGHAGAKGHVAENTVASIKKAVSLGAGMVEFDVRISKDGIPMLMHDASVDRTTGSTGRVSEMTFAELRRIKVAGKHQIPSLEEALKALKAMNSMKAYSQKGRGRIIVNIEVKENSEKAGNTVAGAVKMAGMQEQAIITSTHHAPLKTAKNAGLKTGVIFWSYDIPVPLQVCILGICKAMRWTVEVHMASTAKRLGTKWAMLYFAFATKGLVRRLHRAGIKVGVWTVNSPKLIEKMKRMGVDAIISDYPERVSIKWR